jgi:hypothetical protein
MSAGTSRLLTVVDTTTLEVYGLHFEACEVGRLGGVGTR